ncbi:MAG: hypothetical protein ACR2JI_04230 [Mycobacterium sp.]
MSESEDSQNTRPISVAELLARNGTIGAPPVGGRRHRRRGNADAVSVAELTGEIPVIRDQPVVEQAITEDRGPVEELTPEPEPEAEVEPETASAPEPGAEAAPEPSTETEVIYSEAEDSAPTVVVTEEVAEEVTEEAAEEPAEELDDAEVVEDVTEDVAVEDDIEETVEETIEETVGDDVPEIVSGPPPRSEDPRPRRVSGPELSHDPRPVRAPSRAEQMAPDPVDDSVDLDELLAEQDDDAEQLRSYLKASSGALFSGETLADDIARRGPGVEPEAHDDEIEVRAERGSRLGGLRYALSAVLQSVLAVAFGAGLFLGFDQLWRWNTIVALVLSVLVILGLVVAVRVVRKTEDIASTLIAVAVGAMVTLGPLALLQST